MRLPTLALALALVAAACSDDTSTAPPTSFPLQSTSTTSVTEESTDLGDDVALTATDDGVTADAITIAASFPDLSVVGRDNGDVPAKFRVAVDRVNAEGGINGRMLELVDVAVVDPLGDVASEEACVRHTEDRMVFAVVGLFLREQVLCYSELHDTVAVNVFAIDQSQLDRSTAPLLSIAPLASRTVGRNLDALLADGHLEAGMRVAVHGLASDQALHEQYLDELAARDVEVTTATTRLAETDLQAATAEVEVYAARWLADEVDAVIASSDVVMGDLVAAYDTLGLDIPMLLPEGSDRPPALIAAALGTSLDPLTHAVSLLTEDEYVDQYATDSNGVRDCVDAFVAATGETMSYEEGDGVELTNLAPTALACQAVELFTAVARAAGPELTTESFGRAVDGLGPVEITAVTAGSLGPDKPDVTDTVPVIGFYDPTTDLFVAA